MRTNYESNGTIDPSDLLKPEALIEFAQHDLPATKEKSMLLTTKEAAVALNCSVRTVGRMMARGELIVRKNGSLTRIPRTSVEAWVKRGPRRSA
jgi:excisionase family DNA binding protein